MTYRNIKFKAKTINGGQLVYGYLVKTPGGIWVIYSADTNYRVDPDSIGQFTGFLDSQGMEIYEGDTVAYEYNDDEGGRETAMLPIIWNEEFGSFGVDDSAAGDRSSFYEIMQSFCDQLTIQNND